MKLRENCVKERAALLSILFIICFFGAEAQTMVQGPGNIIHLEAPGAKSGAATDPTIRITTEHAYIEVTPYTSSVVRVRMSRQPFTDDFSYAVVSAPLPTHVHLLQTDSVVVLTTDSLEVRIGRKPFSIGFFTPDHQPINEDEPGLGTSWIGDGFTSYKHMQDGERFIGLGEKTGNLDRRGSGYTNWNEDNYGYAVDKDPLYSTIPFYIGIHHAVCYGIFLDNTYQSDFNFGASNDRFSSFGARGGEANYYFIYQPTVAGIIRSYTALTGRMPLPPLWSLGYQQNRYSYYPETEVLRIAQTLREKKIPADGITLDIHYMNGYRVFTWDKDRFPDPKELTTRLGAMGFTLTVIVDPGIKVDTGYAVYKRGVAKNVFLKYPDGQYYSGQVWPGWSVFTDFTSPKGRDFWRSQVKTYADQGVSGLWNDMNEISTWGQMMPDNVLFDYDGHPTTTLQGHNVYGMQMIRAGYEGARASMHKRPFLLSRSGYAGMQRYSAIWTGDNRAEDDHMLAGVRLLSSLGVSGVAFTGMDIGGFTGNPGIGLYTRWMQLGAFIPYFRNHTGLNTKAAEPWTFGEDVLDICRNYIDLRYTLLPYLYSSFYEATRDGLPVMRSLAINYTHDPHVYDPQFQNEFLCGPSLLVMPQISGTSFAKIYLPAGEWYDAYTGQRQKGGQEKLIELKPEILPVYIKGGSIIPRESLVQNTTEAPCDTLDLHIYQGSEPNTFVYYEDDGASYGYEKGDYYQRAIHFDPLGRTIVLDKPEGGRATHFGHIRLLLHGFDTAQLTRDHAAIAWTSISIPFLPASALATRELRPVGEGAPIEGGLRDAGAVKAAVLVNDGSLISLQY